MEIISYISEGDIVRMHYKFLRHALQISIDLADEEMKNTCNVRKGERAEKLCNMPEARDQNKAINPFFAAELSIRFHIG